MATDLEESFQKKAQLLNLPENEEYKKLEDIYHRRNIGPYVGDMVFGANDGIITTFAIVAGSVGASLSPSVILILGFANIVADGLSMGVGNYLGVKSDRDYQKEQRKKEAWEIENLVDIETEEIREIFRQKGFQGQDLERATQIVTSNKEVWIETMMRDELGIVEETQEDPAKHGLATFTAFIAAGLIPLVPFFLPIGGASPFAVSILLTGLTLFTVGALRSKITVVSWWRGGLEILLMGGLAAVAAYFIGDFLESLIR